MELAIQVGSTGQWGSAEHWVEGQWAVGSGQWAVGSNQQWAVEKQSFYVVLITSPRLQPPSFAKPSTNCKRCTYYDAKFHCRDLVILICSTISISKSCHNLHVQTSTSYLSITPPTDTQYTAANTSATLKDITLSVDQTP